MKHFFLKFFSPERSLFRFIVGTAALTVVIQFFYDLSKDNYGPKGAATLAGFLVLVVALMLWLDYRHAHQPETSRPQENPITPHQGLILLISPFKKDLPLKAIEHHLEKLKYCWLISSKGSLDTAEELAVEINQRWPQINVFDVHDLIVDPENIESTYDVVNRIYEKMTSSLGLAENEIVADITGGQKPMTAGMALACSTPIRKMQYMKTIRDGKGDPVPGNEPVCVLINNITVRSSAGQAQ